MNLHGKRDDFVEQEIYAALFRLGEVDVPVALVLVGLGGGYCKCNIAVQFQHRQAGDFPHSGMVVLYPQDKVDIWGVHQVGHNVITFVAPVEDDNGLAVKVARQPAIRNCRLQPSSSF